jgi:hypothetical protein
MSKPQSGYRATQHKSRRSMPLTRSLAQAALSLLALAATGCDLTDSERICTDHIEPGLHVPVQDSLTGAPAASGARLIARDGTYADTASFPAGRADLDGQVLYAADERPGVYSVTVEKDGYLTWERTGIVVVMDDYDCHVVPVHLVARLQRAP